MREVFIYTDGACRGNPGRGGYGVILVCGDFRKELSQGFLATTNNRMELKAALAGLEALNERCKVTVYSDSKYLVDAHKLGWLEGWKKKGWTRGKKEALANVDLWKQIDEIGRKHEIRWEWVKGHAGHAENERCDELATTAADGEELLVDEGFEG
ncbi:MAG: ribonuclease HI [Verrucomicrobiota bacterium]